VPLGVGPAGPPRPSEPVAAVVAESSTGPATPTPAPDPAGTLARATLTTELATLPPPSDPVAVDIVARALEGEAELLVQALVERAADGQDEDAATLVRALRRQRQLDGLRRAGRMVIELPEGRRIELVRGRLVCADGPPATGPAGNAELARWLEPGAVEPSPADGPLPLDMADELTCVAAWLDRHADRLRLVHVEGELSSPLPAPGHPVAGGVYADRPCSPRS